MRIATLVVSTLALSSFAHADTSKAVKYQVQKAYKQSFGPSVFANNSLHRFALDVSTKGTATSGKFQSQIIDRNQNMGGGMPDYSGTYKKASRGYTITINPASR